MTKCLLLLWLTNNNVCVIRVRQWNCYLNRVSARRAHLYYIHQLIVCQTVNKHFPGTKFIWLMFYCPFVSWKHEIMIRRRRDGVKPHMPTAEERLVMLAAIGGKPYWVVRAAGQLWPGDAQPHPLRVPLARPRGGLTRLALLWTCRENALQSPGGIATQYPVVWVDEGLGSDEAVATTANQKSPHSQCVFVFVCGGDVINDHKTN